MKNPPRKPPKRLVAAIERRDATVAREAPPPPPAAAAANDRHGNGGNGGDGGPVVPDARPVAPLWDLPEQNVRIPLAVLDVTLVFRYVLNDESGRQERAHCGSVPPDATGSTIRRQWGGGRYFLQARIAQRIVASRELLVDGPEAGKLPFGPVGELPSGLVTLNQDPATAGYFAMFQMWMAQQRTDFQLILQMQQDTMKQLAGQFGASMVATHLREQLAEQRTRVKMLEDLQDKAREREKEDETKRLKQKYKGDKTDWVEVVEAVGEIAPAVLNGLPPRLKGFLESLVIDSAKELPAGVTEVPVKG